MAETTDAPTEYDRPATYQRPGIQGLAKVVEKVNRGQTVAEAITPETNT